MRISTYIYFMIQVAVNKKFIFYCLNKSIYYQYYMYQQSGFTHIFILYFIIIFFGSAMAQQSTDHANQTIGHKNVRILQQQSKRLQRLKQFQAYFNSKVTVVPASVPVRPASDYSPIQWPDFGNALKMTDMTVVFLTSGRYDYLSRVLASFFKYNTYPVTKMFIGHDGKDNPRLRRLMDTYKNITWIITNIKVGQLQALDQTFKYIDTQYFYFAEDDFDYFNYGFVQYGLQALMYDPKLMGIQMGRSGYDKAAYLSVGPLRIITQIHSYHFAAFCFSASTRRLKDYKLLEHGYNYATFNGSFGIGSGASESHLSLLYTQMGFHYARTVIQFCYHIGFRSEGHKFAPNERTMDDDLKNLTMTYDNWFNKNNNLEQVKKSLSYLISIEGIKNMTRCRLNSSERSHSVVQKQYLSGKEKNQLIIRIDQLENQNRQLKKKLMYFQSQKNVTQMLKQMLSRQLFSEQQIKLMLQLNNQAQISLLSNFTNDFTNNIQLELSQSKAYFRGQGKILISVLIIVSLLSVLLCVSICLTGKILGKGHGYTQHQEENSMISSNEMKIENKSQG